MRRSLGLIAAAAFAASLAPMPALRFMREDFKPSSKLKPPRSRYMPHQGDRERARRRRQIANGQLTGIGI